MKRIAMVVFSSFPLDVRVRREAEAHIEAGNQVDVLCRTSRKEALKEVVNNINVYRLNLKRKRSGKVAYLFEYLYFFLWAFFKITFLHIKRGYDVIHVHNMPNFIVFTGLFPKLFGAKVILDLHDPMPELFASMFSLYDDSLVVKVLKWLEARAMRFADMNITPNIAFRNLFISRGCPHEKITIVMNSPDENIFKNGEGNKLTRGKERFVIMYHGAVVKRQGPDILMDAVSMVRNKIPGLKVFLYGEGNFMKVVKEKIKELNLSDFVELRGLVIVDKIAEAIKEIDLGVIPNRVNPFTQINFPVRTFEYLVMHKPVIVPRTRGIRDYFSEDSIFYFNPGDSGDLARTILKVYDNPIATQEVLNKSLEVFNNYRWESQKQNLLHLTNNLFS